MTDHQDKEFDDYLAGGSRLSDAYGELPEVEPPEYLDYAIRDEAHRVVGAGAARGRPSVRERARAASSSSRAWQKWTMPLAVAATLVIVVMVGLQLPGIIGQVPQPPAVPAETPAASPAKQQALGGGILKQKKVAPTESGLRAEPPAGRAEQQDRVQGNAGLNEMKPAPKSRAPVDKKFEFFQLKKQAPAKAAPPAAMEAAPAAAAPAAPTATMRQQPASLAGKIGQSQAPGPWLARIEKLKREGKQAEAKRALAAFRQRYPNYPLPRDLRDLQ